MLKKQIEKLSWNRLWLCNLLLLFLLIKSEGLRLKSSLSCPLDSLCKLSNPCMGRGGGGGGFGGSDVDLESNLFGDDW